MGNMGKIRLLGIIQILQQGACRRESGGKVRNSQTCQGTGLKVTEKAFSASIVVKQVGFQRIDGNMVPGPQFFHMEAADQKSLVAYDLGRLIFHQLIIQLL